jgi:nucleoside 2-deoxyribosyltransferase
MSKFKTYLAGAMAKVLPEEANKWRVEATKLFKKYTDNIHTINPCDYYNFTLDPNTYTEKEVKEFDLHMVRNCDLVLVNLDYPDSIGTAIELECATRFWHKPVIGFGTTKNHPWIELSLTKRCNTMEEAVEHIVEFYVINK